VAIFSARDKLENVKAMVLISPGLNYKGLIPSQAIVDYTNPALLITTQDDPYSYSSTERLYNWLLGVKAMQVYKKIGDGSDMLSHQSALGENITDWLVRQMPSPAKPKAVEPEKTAEKLSEQKPETTGKEPEKKNTEQPASAKPAVANVEKPSSEKPSKDKAALKSPSNPVKTGNADEGVTKPLPGQAEATHKKSATQKKIPIRKTAAKTAKKSEPASSDQPNPSQPPIPGG
jgi:hypothetical protein